MDAENKAEIPVLELTYPTSYPSYVFPITVAVDEIDITATGELLYTEKLT